ncbi:hypothetical protein [Methanolobus halotolerans]|uniref:hypothetical protein n=1 Tax=Methanolobus halotolerans TaxID=2052935 RepID=UPI0014367863|nr:hypothetical protein [Methanolobus halotolerans]
MATEANSTINKNKGATHQAPISDDDAKEYVKEGFYSACGQAFIRVSPNKRTN